GRALVRGLPAGAVAGARARHRARAGLRGRDGAAGAGRPGLSSRPHRSNDGVRVPMGSLTPSKRLVLDGCLHAAVAVAGAAPVVGIVVAPVVLRNAPVVVMVMMVVVMTRDRGAGVERPGSPDRESAGSKRDRTDGGDAVSCARQHRPSFLGAGSVIHHVLKAEIARSSEALWFCQS